MTKTKPSKSAKRNAPVVKKARAKGASGSGTRPRRARSQKAELATRPESVREVVGPIDDSARRTLACHAIEKLRTGGRSSNKSQVWSLGNGFLLEAAIRIVSGREGVDTITASVTDELRAAKVSERSFKRFLTNVRSVFRDLVYMITKKSATDAVIDAMGGDPEAISKLVLSKVAAQVVNAVDYAAFHELDPKAQHVLLRAGEMFVEASRIHADARLKEAQVEKIADQILAAQLKRSGGDRGGKAKAAPLLSRDEIVKTIRQVMLGDTASGGRS